MVHIISELLEFSRNAYATFEHAEVETIIEEAIKANEAKPLRQMSQSFAITAQTE